ncbi:hypothetical protein FOA43_004290 [Brettanomyces nanus]|uniref:DNA helicase n=1 Tax=Eeniella nana TaxID=13502 RepID=A0A875S6D3_EENNA|nr:uncharacterized protein FOA43_004290 [Brettanomyces nanus]QPG76896.1 hypothetical protein FOA43_004290 [Brettanomyces nanus]
MSSFYGDSDLTDDGEIFDIHQGIIFAIHLTPTMYSSIPIIFSNLLSLIHDLAKTMPNTGIGCYLFNCSNKATDETGGNGDQNASDWRRQLFSDRKGIYPVFRLNDINSSQLKRVNNLLQQSKGEDIIKLFKLLSEDPVTNNGQQLSWMLNQCQDDFTYIPKFVKRYSARRVFLFTDCDKPFNGSTSMRTTLQHNIHDLNAAKIGIIPFLMARGDGSDEQFNLKEYKILLEVGENGNLVDEENSKSRVNQIALKKIQEKISKTKEIKRTAFSCPLRINDQLTISIKGYSMFNEVKLRMMDSFYDDEGTYKLVHTKTYKLSKETGETTKENEVVRAFHVGDQYFNMDKSYYERLLRFGEKEKPILKVLGFRKTEYFNPSYTIGTAVFIAPDDNGDYTHSRRAFSALYQSMIRKRKMCLVWGMPRKMSYPSLYYMIPTDESLGFKTNVENYPQGFAMIQIPDRDQIRMLPNYVTETLQPTRIMEPNLFDSIVNELQSGFKSLENPQLSWYFKVFEDYLLQREVEGPEIKVESAVSEVVDKQKQMNKIDELKLKIMKLRLEPSANVKAMKNQLNRMSNSENLHPKEDREADLPPSKRTKLLTDELVIKAWKLRELNKFNAQQLRVYVNSKPNLIERSNTKDEMIRNIEEYLNRVVTSRE